MKIRSLRVRIFVLVWPALLLALILFSSLISRWSTVELQRLDDKVAAIRDISANMYWIVDRLAAIPRADTAQLRSVLEAIAVNQPNMRSLIVASEGEGVIASSAWVRDQPDFTVEPDRFLSYVSTVRVVSHSQLIVEREVRTRAPGTLIDASDAADPRFVVVLPEYQFLDEQQSIAGSAGVESTASVLRRRILIALAIALVVSGMLVLLLSRRLTGRVEALVTATTDVGRGRLAARVPVEGDDDIATLARSFNAMAETLQKSEGHRRQMVSDVAHELRTPLTNLLGLLESAHDGLRPLDQTLVASLQEEASLLHRLADDLRDLSLAESGDLAMARDVLDVGEQVERVVKGFDQRHGIEFTPPIAPLELVADAQRFGQVLRNLIQNAVTHSPTPGSVRVTVEQPGDEVTISVADQGPGIAADELPRIWDRFYRIDAARSRDTGGMGLGLAVARRLAEAMGGRLTAESTVREGSVFRVHMAATAACPTAGAGPARDDHHGATIDQSADGLST